LLDHILRDAAMDQAIVFTATKRGADDLAEHLADTGFSVMALHGDMNQRQRSRTLTEVQDGRVRVLVATDVAARGIDVQAISHAINYDLPMQPEDYVHRIGRTGRAGRDGLAYTLAVHGERHKVRRIEHFIGHQIPSEVIAGLEPQRTPSARPEGAGRGAGGKKGGRFSNDRSSAPSGGYAGRESRPYAPRGDKSFADRGERTFAPRGDKPFAPRGDKPFAPRGDKPFAERGEKSFAPRGDKPFAPRGEKSYAPRGEKSYGDRSYAPRGDQPHAARSENPFANARTEPRSFEPRTDRGASDRPAYAGKPARPARDFAPRAAAPSGKTFAPRGDAPARSGAPRPGAPRAATGARRGFTFDGGRR